MSLCQCIERPCCQMIGCDMRADWTVIQPRLERWSRPERAKFMCDWHHQKYTDQRPWPGIDKPKWAGDEWRPSLAEHIRLCDMEIRRCDRAAQAASQPPRSDVPELSRMKSWTPQQRAQVEVLRCTMRTSASNEPLRGG